MRYRFLSVINDIIVMIINYIVLVPVWMVIYCGFHFEFPLYKPMAMFVFPVIYYLYRRYVDKLWLFLPLHIIVPIVFAMMVKDSALISIADIILVGGMAIYSFALRMQKKEPGENPINPIAAAFIFIAVSIAIRYFGEEEKFWPLTVMAVLFAALTMIQKYIERFSWFDFMNGKTVKDIPTMGLLKAGGPYVLGISITFVAASLVLLNRGLMEKIYLAIHNAWINLLIWFFSLFASGEEEETAGVSNGGGQINIEDFLPVTEQKKSLFWEILQKILLYIIVFVAVSIIILGIYFGIKALITNFKGRDKSEKETANADFTEERESILVKSQKKTKRNLFFLSPSEKIRRLYLKLVKNEARDIEEYSKITVREFAGAFPGNLKEAAYSFAGLYEKARYSPNRCSKKDYELAKEYASKLMQ